ncbi:hypothetical protein DC094_16225 [Pelagibaculum spongiae]|uniref:Alpha-2-macroglobulin n=2 Tax=Pelagibaculum spongiae TaxID=2080658 RepID=A0A2V1GRE2_9GAMM|nr:hypothetical protein DC094_16225 [Pelagibaculum spongiae]
MLVCFQVQASDFKIADLAERQIDGRNYLCLAFNQPADQSKDLSSYIEAYSKDRKKSGSPIYGQSSWAVEDDGRMLCLVNTKPYTQYKIKVAAGLPAASGQKLANADSFTQKTRRLKPAVNFIDAGIILSPGSEGLIPVATLDVDQVDVNFHRLKESSLLDLLQNYNRSWKWQLLKSLPKQTDLVYSARFKLDAETHRRVERSIPISDIEALKIPGVYVAAMKIAGDYTTETVTKLFVISDIGLHARSYKNQMSVTALSLSSGAPLAGVDIRLLNSQGGFLRQQTTDNNGQIILADYKASDSNNRPALALALQNESMSMLALDSTALGLSDFDLGQRQQNEQELMIYAPRDLYRPGEKAQFSMLLRDHDGRFIAQPVLTGSVIKPDNRQFVALSVSAESEGYYQYEFDIPANAATGQWSLAMVRPGGGPQVVYRFKVEEFLPERMKLSYSFANETGQQASKVLSENEQLLLTVQGDYLYGAPAAGNRFQQQVLQRPVQTGLEQFKGYYFGNADGYGSRSTNLPDVELDQDGRYTTMLPIQRTPLKVPARLTFQGSLYESNGRAVNRRWSRLIWPQANMIGVRSGFDFNKEYAKANTTTDFQLVRLNEKQQMIAGEVEVTLVRRHREGYWEYSNSGWKYHANYREYDVLRQKVTLDGSKPANLALPLKWGDYRLEVRDPDSNLLTKVRLRAGREWYWRWQEHSKGNHASRPDKITLALDKPSYLVGEIVQLSIKPPYLPSKSDGKTLKFQALVQVEADRPLWLKWVDMDQNGTILDIPIEASWDRHDLYVSVLMTRPIGDEFEQKLTRRSMGLIHLPLNRQSRTLQIAMDLPQKSMPNKKLNVPVTVTAEMGVTPENIQVTIAAVDHGVLSLTDFETPDPLDYFFGRRAYQVQARDIYHQLIKPTVAKHATLRFGGDAPARGGKRNVSDVQIVSLFSGPVKLDEKGKGNVIFDLPDFSGKLKFMAVAFSDQMLGSTEQDLTVATPVVAQIAMPRFIAKGDISMVALDLNNISGISQTVTASFVASEGLQFKGKQSFTVSLNDRQKQTIKLPMKANKWNGLGKIQLSIEGIQYQGEQITLPEKSWKIAIRPPWPAETFVQQEEILPGEFISMLIEESADIDPDSLQASLLISDAAALDVASYVRSLLHYPYGCLEQTLSSAQPWLLANRPELSSFNIKPVSQAKRTKAMEIAMERLQRKQKSNGGFGLWSDRSPEEQWLTVFALDFFQQAQSQGFPVDASMMLKAAGRVQEYLKLGAVRSRYSDENDHYKFATRAYAAYVLSKNNQASLGDMRRLFDRFRKNAQSPLPLAQLGLALIRQGDKKRGDLAIEEAFTVEPRKYFWSQDYGSRIRDRALMIALLIEDGYQVSKARLQSFELAEDLKGDSWLSTQEQYALVRAALSLQSSAEDSWQLQVDAANQQNISGTGSQRTAVEYPQLLQPMLLSSQQALFARLEVSGYRTVSPPQFSNKINIERKYYDETGQPIQLEFLRSGDLVVVELLVNSEDKVPDALVVDLLPAGLELENQNLSGSIRLQQINIDGKPISERKQATTIEHEEYRDDRYVAAVNLRRNREARLYYLARAVTPGRYKVPAASVESMYHPEIRANGRSDQIVEILGQ